jgi:Flp pilus assembly protein TadD
MHRYQFKQGRLARLAVIAGSSAAIAFGLCGCQTTADVTGSLGDQAQASSSPDSRRDIEAWRERYKANPKDPAVALEYGKALRATGERSQAVAVLQQAALANPRNKALLAGYGRALADNGNFQQAFDVLSQAHSPEDPDWHILSAQGAVLDQLGRFDEARQYYASALKIAPDEPSVLSNLGLSYLLSKDLAKAEETLRRAHDHDKANPRVRMNLAFVMSLRGHQGGAEKIVKADLAPDEAMASVAELKRLMAKKDASPDNRKDAASDKKEAAPDRSAVRASETTTAHAD